MSTPVKHDISVVVPAYNAATVLALVLKPLIAMQTEGFVREVIVVDDCSSDATASIAAGLQVHLLRNLANQGPAGARNVGAAVARGTLLWFVDSDVVAHSDGPSQIQQVFRDPEVVAVFGSYDEDVSEQSWPSKYKNLLHRFYHQREGAVAGTFWAGCGAVCAEAFAKAGGFDAQTYQRASIEDIELGYRLNRIGTIRIAPDLLGTHLKKWGVWDILKADIFLRAVPWSRLIIAREGLSETLNIAQAERARALIALCMACALVLSLASITFVLLVATLFGAAIIANFRLFHYFRQNGGFGFAVFCLLFHQAYYIYSSLIFVGCWVGIKTGLISR